MLLGLSLAPGRSLRQEVHSAQPVCEAGIRAQRVEDRIRFDGVNWSSYGLSLSETVLSPDFMPCFVT